MLKRMKRRKIEEFLKLVSIMYFLGNVIEEKNEIKLERVSARVSIKHGKRCITNPFDKNFQLIRLIKRIDLSRPARFTENGSWFDTIFDIR